jgi:hypothetical protein
MASASGPSRIRDTFFRKKKKKNQIFGLFWDLIEDLIGFFFLFGKIELLSQKKSDLIRCI